MRHAHRACRDTSVTDRTNDLDVSQRSRQGWSDQVSGLVPGEIAFTVLVPLSYAFSAVAPLVGIGYATWFWWVVGSMLLAGAAAAVRVGIYWSALTTSLVGTLVMIPATLALPEVTLPWHVLVAAAGVALTVIGSVRTERLRTQWTRSS